MEKTCIIVGMGHAAAQLAASLRRQGWAGSIHMVGAEDRLPYHRPPLSKEILLGKQEEPDLIRPAAFYEKIEVSWQTGAEVSSLDRADKCLHLADGTRLNYDKLVLATGGRVRRLQLAGSDSLNVHYLRTARDATVLKAAMQPGTRAVIVGGGYIGLEVASACRSLQIDATVLEAEDRLLKRIAAPELSDFYARIHREEGVNIVLNQELCALEGQNQVAQLRCEDGSLYEADFVVVGIGIEPNTELAAAAGLKTEDGIWVDEFGQTEDPDIFAVGDCANFPYFYTQSRLRLESVPHATDQANAVAAKLCDKPAAYRAIPWFWSNQYDLKLQIAGVNTGYDQVLVKGEPQTSRDFVLWYLKDQRLIAADCVNRPRDFMVARQILPAQPKVPAEQLLDPNQDLKALIQLYRK